MANYVMQTPDAQRYLDLTVQQIKHTLPLFAREGKTDITIGIGCTGGMHRSVAFANALFHRLDADGQPTEIVHRDIMRDRAHDQAEQKNKK